MIDKHKIDEIKKIISKRFPEFKDVEPKITQKTIKPQTELYKKLSLGTPKRLSKIFKLKFAKKIETADNVEIKRLLVVTLDSQGEIVKITETR